MIDYVGVLCWSIQQRSCWVGTLCSSCQLLKNLEVGSVDTVRPILHFLEERVVLIVFVSLYLLCPGWENIEAGPTIQLFELLLMPLVVAALIVCYRRCVKMSFTSKLR